MSTYYYYANPEIYILPRGKKYLFEEEKQTVDGQEETIKKCEINKILNTYKDNESYDFHLSDKRFKAIESRIYLDLWKDYSNNKFTVSKKCCIGFFKYKDSKNDFMDKEAKYNGIELICENKNCPQLKIYLTSGDVTNKNDPSKPILFSLNDEENRVREFEINIEYNDTVLLPVNSEIKINARFYGQEQWKKDVTFILYRNNQNTLDSFKIKTNLNTDFFVVPRYAISNNQAECVKQLEIINNQVFSRNKKFTSFSFVRENGFFEDSNNQFNAQNYVNLTNNIANSITYFKSDSKDSSKGCRTGNLIGDFKTFYTAYNFFNYGSNENLINYLAENYSISKNILKGKVLDSNFLFGNSQYEGIVNLYKNIVIPFINSFEEQLNLFRNHNVSYLSCPAYNENYHRGPLTIDNEVGNKNLYKGETSNIKPLAEIFNGYTGGNILPIGTIVEFTLKKDNYAFDKDNEHYYKVSSITIPGYDKKTFLVNDEIYVKLSYENKKKCKDSKYICNKGNYTFAVGLTDSRDISAINNYDNYGIPYFMHNTDMPKSNENGRSNKMTKEELFSWNETKDNWFSYEKKPNTEDFGIDCSGLVVNSLLSLETYGRIKFESNKKEKLDISATMMGGEDNCRQISNVNMDNINTYIQKGDVVYKTSKHIGICVEGNLSYKYDNTYVTVENKNSLYFNTIHNYGTESVRVQNNNNYTKSFFYKTIQGPVKHWNLQNISYSRIYLWG